MHAEIVAIGSELTTGAKLDTNSQWLSLELSAIGIPVHYHTTMSDDIDAMVTVFRTAVERSNIVLITGGLGPTLDDLTRQALAQLADVELELHESSLEFIQSLFARRNREMPERNAIQAMFPAGSEPVRNPRGTAPGIWMHVARKDVHNDGRSPALVTAMPGVPSEMKRMFREELLPRLSGDGRVIQRARINCFGIGESHAEELLGDLTERGRDPEVGITVHEATITLRITAQGDSTEYCRNKIAETARIARERLGDVVFGEEDEEIEHVLVQMLASRNLTMATSESGTGGLLAHRLTEVDGFETVFLGGSVGLTATHVDGPVGNAPVDAQTAEAMAAGCRARYGTDFALAVTDCPRFDPDDTNTTPPQAFIALAGPDMVRVVEHTLIGDPAIRKIRAAKAVMNLLRLHLLRS
jgi:nicotinamide-nucleotide amidase